MVPQGMEAPAGTAEMAETARTAHSVLPGPTLQTGCRAPAARMELTADPAETAGSADSAGQPAREEPTVTAARAAMPVLAVTAVTAATAGMEHRAAAVVQAGMVRMAGPVVLAVPQVPARAPEDEPEAWVPPEVAVPEGPAETAGAATRGLAPPKAIPETVKLDGGAVVAVLAATAEMLAAGPVPRQEESAGRAAPAGPVGLAVSKTPHRVIASTVGLGATAETAEQAETVESAISPSMALGVMAGRGVTAAPAALTTANVPPRVPRRARQGPQAARPMVSMIHAADRAARAAPEDPGTLPRVLPLAASAVLASLRLILFISYPAFPVRVQPCMRSCFCSGHCWAR